MKKIKLLTIFLVPLVASGLLVANVASAQTTDNQSAKEGARNYSQMGQRGGISGIGGKVAGISGNILTITGRNNISYTVDATNAVVIKNNVASSLSNIIVGDTITVRGTLNGTSVTATSIRDGLSRGGIAPGKNKMPNAQIIQGNGQPVVGGNVATVSGTALSVTNKSNVTYTVDVSGAVISKNNATSSASDINVGDRVVVQGTINGTSITASSIIDQGVMAMGTNSTSTQENNKGFFGAIRGFFHNMFGFF
jgi:hypothetical protein